SGAKGKHDILLGAEVAGCVLLPVHKIDKVPGKILVFGSIPCGIRASKTGTYITHGKLAMLVVVEVMPILLDVHFVRIKSVQPDTGCGISIDKAVKVRQGSGAEVIH